MKTFKKFPLRKYALIVACATAMLFTSCSKDEDGSVEPAVEPIVLDCGYFGENKNIHLVNDPNAPVDYIITCDPAINGDFTVDAGVVIAFESGAGLKLGKYGNGKIQMIGTADNPIILTGTQKDKGFWRGIQISSDNPANQMDYVTVEYAGQSGRGGWALQGSVIGAAKGVMKMDHCTIQHGALIGLHWVSGALNAGELTLSNSTLTGNDVPIQTSVNHINSIDGSSSYSGNVNDYIKLSGNDAYQDVTFHKIDVPFLSVGFKPDNGAIRRFKFEPGVTLLMEAGSQIRFQNAFHYNHEIIMVGTANDPITIKGKEDVPGYWEGLYLYASSNPLNEIGFLDIANAGTTNGYPNGAIQLRGSNLFLNMHDVNFIDCFEFAVSIENPNAINFNYSNLNLTNTPKLFSSWSGGVLANP